MRALVGIVAGLLLGMGAAVGVLWFIARGIGAIVRSDRAMRRRR